jgi:hypothetical protein
MDRIVGISSTANRKLLKTPQEAPPHEQASPPFPPLCHVSPPFPPLCHVSPPFPLPLHWRQHEGYKGYSGYEGLGFAFASGWAAGAASAPRLYGFAFDSGWAAGSAPPRSFDSTKCLCSASTGRYSSSRLPVCRLASATCSPEMCSLSSSSQSFGLIHKTFRFCLNHKKSALARRSFASTSSGSRWASATDSTGVKYQFGFSALPGARAFKYNFGKVGATFKQKGQQGRERSQLE